MMSFISLHTSGIVGRSADSCAQQRTISFCIRDSEFEEVSQSCGRAPECATAVTICPTWYPFHGISSA
jgi:hypothetical protein